MIKIALKHFLYELSIDILFNKLIQNFNASNDDSVPKVGDFIKRASHIYGDEHYYNCVVKSVETRGASAEPYHIVSLTYEFSSGADLDELYYNDEEMLEDEDDMLMIDSTQTLADLIDREDLEFVEGDGYIVLNSKYYTFSR